MKNTFSFIPSFLLLLSFAHISRISEQPSVSGTEETLTQSIWTEMESWKDKDGDGVFVLEMDSCQADNNWYFKVDGTFEMTEDFLKCEPDMPYLDTLSCNWLLRENETVLSLTTDESDLDFQIYAIGEHELILYLVDLNSPSTPSWEKIILRR